MDVKAKEGKSGYTLSISGELTIYTAEDGFKKLFSNPLWFERNLTLDLSSVAEIDTAGAQLLLMLVKEVGEAGDVFLESVSESVDSLLSLLSLHYLFSEEAVKL